MQGLTLSTTRKLFAAQLAACRPIPESRNKYAYRGIDLTRAWVQGVVVAVETRRLAVDDGTGVLWVTVDNIAGRFGLGAYVMVIGPPAGPGCLQAHQVMALGVGREPVWFLEVLEYWALLTPQVIELLE
ncbi:hypothetical protein ACHHYP_00732 [Achlya hypogyna]|uniref:Uncharacterized protein n=1 Tax=Achlya hypogyna TaxID=1202772 RepID=A0A1V9ZTW4_ACHHY|nr:hypothetical protein ACHHYP_00732 [Achlya hypogyna]